MGATEELEHHPTLRLAAEECRPPHWAVADTADGPSSLPSSPGLLLRQDHQLAQAPALTGEANPPSVHVGPAAPKRGSGVAGGWDRVTMETREPSAGSPGRSKYPSTEA